jgi:hypothetical protein
MLPTEIWLTIFAHNDIYTLTRLSSVSKTFNRIANNNALWKSIYQREICAPGNIVCEDYKRLYRDSCKNIFTITNYREKEKLTFFCDMRSIGSDVKLFIWNKWMKLQYKGSHNYVQVTTPCENGAMWVKFLGNNTPIKDFRNNTSDITIIHIGYPIRIPIE